jgi:hypothetical protein
MVMPPAMTQHQGIPAFDFLLLSSNQGPVTENEDSHFESVQKATIAGTIWEKS